MHPSPYLPVDRHQESIANLKRRVRMDRPEARGAADGAAETLTVPLGAVSGAEALEPADAAGGLEGARLVALPAEEVGVEAAAHAVQIPREVGQRLDEGLERGFGELFASDRVVDRGDQEVAESLVGGDAVDVFERAAQGHAVVRGRVEGERAEDFPVLLLQVVHHVLVGCEVELDSCQKLIVGPRSKQTSRSEIVLDEVCQGDERLSCVHVPEKDGDGVLVIFGELDEALHGLLRPVSSSRRVGDWGLAAGLESVLESSVKEGRMAGDDCSVNFEGVALAVDREVAPLSAI